MPSRRWERRWSASGGSVGVDASVADAESADGTAAASDGLETFQDGNQDMWEGNWEGKKGSGRVSANRNHMAEMLSVFNPRHLMVHRVVPPHALPLVLCVVCVGGERLCRASGARPVSHVMLRLLGRRSGAVDAWRGRKWSASL